MKTIITIKRIYCNACKTLIEDVFEEMAGVKSCAVNFQTGETIVEHDENADWAKFKKEVESVGEYKVEVNQ